MTLTIAPATTVEEEPYQRLIDAIPDGEFYLRAAYTQPRRNGTATVPFVISGQRGDPDATGSRIMVDVYVNEALQQRVAMTANVVQIPVKLEPPPTINYIRVVEGVLDGPNFFPTGESTGTSCVVTNYGSVLYGAALDYYRKVWLPYLIQNWSLTSEWGCRQVEWYFKYHRRMPDTQAMRTLAVRLASRATWSELPTVRGVQDMISALTATEPVLAQATNERDYYDLALWPFRPTMANHGGWDIDLWFPDLPTAREQALIQLAGNLDYLVLENYSEGHTFVGLEGQDTHLDLLKDRSQSNLAFLLRQIGPHDYWRAFLQRDRHIDHFQRFWDNAWDNIVHPPGLGAADTFDSYLSGTEGAPGFSDPLHKTTFDLGVLDTSNLEPFTELWTGLGVNTADGTETWDSVVEVAKCEHQIPPDQPSCWEWEWTGVLDISLATTGVVTNTLHGGAPPDYEA